MPLGSFLFLGPTGVGKTELTLEFARYLFGDHHVFRFDMSEFLHLDNVKLFMGDETGRTGRLGEVLSKHQKASIELKCLSDRIQQRGNVMRKMEASSLADLVRIAEKLGADG